MQTKLEPLTIGHQQADMSLWQGRIDPADGSLGLRWHQQIQSWHTAGITTQTQEKKTQAQQNPVFALLGFRSDEGVRRNQGRIGAAHGPVAIRRALASLPLHHELNLYDAGDVYCSTGTSPENALEKAQTCLAQELVQLLQAKTIPLLMGGGHEIAWGTFQGLAQYLQSSANAEKQFETHQPAPRIGIINFDAHFDLREENFASSGTPFLQIANYCQQQLWPFHYACLGVSEFANTQVLYQRAKQLQVWWEADENMRWQALDRINQNLQRFIDQVDHLYLTICMDAFPAAVCPGVSAPAAKGVELGLVEFLIDHICRSNKLRIIDVAETNPQYDIDQRTARVAARLIARIASRIHQSSSAEMTSNLIAQLGAAQ